MIDWTTPEEVALENDIQRHQWALLQEAVKRSRRRYTQAVIAQVMFPDGVPLVDRRRVHQELAALRKAMEEIDAERRLNIT